MEHYNPFTLYATTPFIPFPPKPDRTYPEIRCGIVFPSAASAQSYDHLLALAIADRNPANPGRLAVIAFNMTPAERAELAVAHADLKSRPQPRSPLPPSGPSYTALVHPTPEVLAYLAFAPPPEMRANRMMADLRALWAQEHPARLAEPAEPPHAAAAELTPEMLAHLGISPVVADLMTPEMRAAFVAEYAALVAGAATPDGDGDRYGTPELDQYWPEDAPVEHDRPMRIGEEPWRPGADLAAVTARQDAEAQAALAAGVVANAPPKEFGWDKVEALMTQAVRAQDPEEAKRLMDQALSVECSVPERTWEQRRRLERKRMRREWMRAPCGTRVSPPPVIRGRLYGVRMKKERDDEKWDREDALKAAMKVHDRHSKVVTKANGWVVREYGVSEVQMKEMRRRTGKK
ncbi:hypothetical protein EDC01DRAFT_632570 [Geopyxis carbonaria]|nr:hypothetical protein EDC01DRAFT_632570 [Geopyxis carbonaria]